ncbi:MAG: hypothetical protein ABTQ26_07935 [Azonexus sp.]
MDNQRAEEGSDEDKTVKVVGGIHGDLRWLVFATLRRRSLMA